MTNLTALKWIGVKEGLPETKRRVLVCRSGLICVGELLPRKDSYGWHNSWSIDGCAHLISVDEITHWMPLPPLPEESANEGPA